MVRGCVVLVLVLALAGCGRLVEAPMNAVSRSVSGLVQRLIQPRLPAASSLKVSGEAVIGRVVHYRTGKLVVLEADGVASRQAAALLSKPVAGRVRALSMLHPVGDAPMVRRSAAVWPKDTFVSGVFDEQALVRLFAGAQGERVVAFGHIEGTGAASAAFVAYGSRETHRVPVSMLLHLARTHQVQLSIVGCKSFKAGAPAGPLHNLEGRELPRILTSMREAATYGELFASMGTPDQPVLVDPIRIMVDINSSVIALRRGGTPASVMYQALDGNEADATVGHGTRAGRAAEGVVLAFIAVALAYFGALKPADRIGRWREFRTGRPSRAANMLRRVTGRVEARTDLIGRVAPFFEGVLLVFVLFAFADLLEGGPSAAPALWVSAPFALAVVLGRIAEWSAGRGRHEHAQPR